MKLPLGIAFFNPAYFAAALHDGGADVGGVAVIVAKGRVVAISAVAAK